MGEITLDLLLNQVPYLVKVVPFPFNAETRFRVSYNDSPEYIFAWDSAVRQFVSIGDDSSTIPNELEEAIAVQLLQIATDGRGDAMQE
ncbi:hypothetical protein AB6805_00970 [Chitinophaga sp. RCC_12]|uniref:hypothetical protein n=1 Tax=Chitinophaga sp. RCC_12 TaxID=3239226 RepID=UPI00352358A4